MPKLKHPKSKVKPHMPKSKDWRRLEKAMVEVLLSEGYALDDNARTGDKFIAGRKGKQAGIELNITAFAQALADLIQLKETDQ